MTLYFITGNKNKFNEVKHFLGEVEQLEIDLPEIQSINPKEIVEAKLKEALKHKDGSFIIEDTSLYLSCLKGLPGPLIKWFLATIGRKGLFEIADKFSIYDAEAKTIIGYARNQNEISFFEGVIKGTIVEPKHDSDFGWDPIFQPEGYSKTFAEMTKEEKTKISMRGQALKKLKEFLIKRDLR